MNFMRFGTCFGVLGFYVLLLGQISCGHKPNASSSVSPTQAAPASDGTSAPAIDEAAVRAVQANQWEIHTVTRNPLDPSVQSGPDSERAQVILEVRRVSDGASSLMTLESRALGILVTDRHVHSVAELQGQIFEHEGADAASALRAYLSDLNHNAYVQAEARESELDQPALEQLAREFANFRVPNLTDLRARTGRNMSRAVHRLKETPGAWDRFWQHATELSGFQRAQLQPENYGWFQVRPRCLAGFWRWTDGVRRIRFIECEGDLMFFGENGYPVRELH